MLNSSWLLLHLSPLRFGASWLPSDLTSLGSAKVMNLEFDWLFSLFLIERVGAALFLTLYIPDQKSEVFIMIYLQLFYFVIFTSSISLLFPLLLPFIGLV